MKGVVYLGDGEVEVREFSVPVPGPGEVLVEMKVAGLCGSDLHKYHKSREWAEERGGMISGHEPCGVVAQLGPGVENPSVGDRVSVYHSLGCGHCTYCLSGEPVFCSQEGAFGRTRDGCHADYMLAPANYCLPLPDTMSFAVGASLACSACTAYAGVHKVPAAPGEILVVFGLGPVGLTTLLMGQAMGFRGVGVEVTPFRLDLARRLGVETLIDATTADPVEVVRELTGGEGVSAIVECSGSDRAQAQTVLMAAPRAVVVIVGAGSETICFEPDALRRYELTIRGNAVFPVSGYFDAVRFLEKHHIPLDEMVTHRYTIDQAPEAFAEFEGSATGKVIFEWK